MWILEREKCLLICFYCLQRPFPENSQYHICESIYIYTFILYFVYVGMIRTCICNGICIPFGIHMCNVDRVAPLLFVSIVFVFVLSLVYGPMC